jgi:aspartate ammonia-lyase
MDTRLEKDMLGELAIPSQAYWGIHTERALHNFRPTGSRCVPQLVHALAQVKLACCQANTELGYLSTETGQVLAQACEEVAEGRWDEQFPLDALQGGAGTSLNMNMNEVLANRALEILGHPKGAYDVVHPLDHANLHQSTNDVFPTAIKVAGIYGFRELSRVVAELQGAMQRREKAFADVVKMGRTELQIAVPMTLGAEFGAFAEAFARDRWRTFKCEERLRQVNLGGTAVGTGLAAPRQYIFLVIEKLREITGLGVCRGENAVDQTANADAFVEVMGIAKALASDLLKICADLRLLHMLGEIRLPAVQAGSSIMPGKVNPVILESVMQTAMLVQSHEGVVTQCASHGSLQINEFLPLLGHTFLSSLDMLGNATGMLAKHVEGIEAGPETCLAAVATARTNITAFLPSIGYERAQALLDEFAATGRTDFRQFLVEELGNELVNQTLSAQNLTSLGYRD